jgi:ADP-ribose pyrophosphatase YjhB (NUDIX family)
MITTPPRVRVAAYVIRSSPHPELLIFQVVGDEEAGLQIPAGGVDPGETLHSAVVREVDEETGLTGLTVLDELTTDSAPHPRTGRPRLTTFFHLRAPEGTPNAWTHRVHGDGNDAGQLFACRFAPLPLPHPLADAQDAWLGAIDPALAGVTQFGRT